MTVKQKQLNTIILIKQILKEQPCNYYRRLLEEGTKIRTRYMTCITKKKQKEKKIW